MEGNGVVLCDNLIKWLQTLNLAAKHGNPTELSDGVAIAEALSQIAPEYFTPTWNSKIKTDVGHNWRLKVSNLKKILEGVVDYHQDVLNLSLQEFTRPDVVNIAEHADPSDLGRLLQLVLSCAVNCIKKEEYITRIMDLELSCQRSIMQAIQELETLTLGLNRGSLHTEAVAADQTDAEMREALAQRCHDLDTQVKILQEEKMTLLSEVSRLTAAREAAIGYENSEPRELDEAGASLGPAHAGTLRYSNMRAQLEALKDELDKVELQRDDHRVRADALERELAVLKLRNEELQIAASENVALKDEVDALRETAAKAAALEATVASYKKRMEEHVDLRRQVKLLEHANTEHVQRAIEHEQAAARANAVRAQLDLYKKQVTELNEKLDAEMARADRLEIEGKRQASRCAALQRERDALMAERDALRDNVDELRCTTAAAGVQMTDIKEKLDAEMARADRLEIEGKRQASRCAALQRERDALMAERDALRDNVDELRCTTAAAGVQMTDINEKLDAEMSRADRLEIEGKRQASRCAALQRERDALMAERDALRDNVDEQCCTTAAAGAKEDNVSQELIPNDLKERLIRLEHENKLLRQHQGAQADQASVQAEEYVARLEKQRAMNREAHQRIMQLEAMLEAPHPRLASAIEDNQRKSLQVEELQASLAEERQRANKLQEALSAREAELLATEDKYRKCVEKAKEVIKTLDPRTTGQQSLSDITLGYSRGAHAAPAARGDAAPANNNRHEWSGGGSTSEEGSRSANSEQRLLASAWYQLGARCHRDAVDARFAMLSGNSFLARQRRQPPRPRPHALTSSPSPAPPAPAP